MSTKDNLFDIKHHSPSTVNSFIERRHEWYLKKIRGVTFPGSHPMLRGAAVEAGINHFILNEDTTIEDCIKEGLKIWSEGIIALGEDFDMRQSLGPAIKKAIQFFQEKEYHDGDTRSQVPIEVYLNGCELPFKGFLDFLRPDKLIDTKCVGKTPTLDKVTNLLKHKQSYCLQAAVYKAATGLEPYFCYIIPLKTEVKVIESGFSKSDLEWGLQLATKAAQCIEKIISNPIEGGLFEAFMFPNFDTVYEGAQLNIALSEFGM